MNKIVHENTQPSVFSKFLNFATGIVAVIFITLCANVYYINYTNFIRTQHDYDVLKYNRQKTIEVHVDNVVLKANQFGVQNAVIDAIENYVKAPNLDNEKTLVILLQKNKPVLDVKSQAIIYDQANREADYLIQEQLQYQYMRNNIRQRLGRNFFNFKLHE